MKTRANQTYQQTVLMGMRSSPTNNQAPLSSVGARAFLIRFLGNTLNP